MQHEVQRPAGTETGEQRQRTPRKGDRIQLRLPRLGVYPRGTVYYVDDLQILVKWDDGLSESLRGEFADRFRISRSRATSRTSSRTAAQRTSSPSDVGWPGWNKRGLVGGDTRGTGLLRGMPKVP
jgi:hypothetical protein